jgi:hypothetical protein
LDVKRPVEQQIEVGIVERRVEKRREQYQRSLAKVSVQRVQPLGKDRDHSVYWFFDLVDMTVPSGRLFVQRTDDSWGFYSKSREVRCFFLSVLKYMFHCWYVAREFHLSLVFFQCQGG